MRSSVDVDVVRERWRRKADELGLPDPEGLRSTKPHGLGRRFKQLSTRVVVLPADPFHTDLTFDEGLWSWWGEDRPAPFGGAVSWTRTVPTSDAAVRVEGHGDSWKTCLALHRHGGVEIVSHDAYDLRDDVRVFRLVRTVALLWIALDAQALVLEHLGLTGPWQVVLALHDTKNAVFGDVAEGWAEPHDIRIHDPPRCPDANVLIRREIEEFPMQPQEVRELAFDVAARIEDSWGLKERRFLARTGTMVGKFDARGWNR